MRFSLQNQATQYSHTRTGNNDTVKGAKLLKPNVNILGSKVNPQRLSGKQTHNFQVEFVKEIQGKNL